MELNFNHAAFIALLSFECVASEKSDIHEIRTADILHVEKSSHGWEARVTLRIPKEIPLKHWVNCNYYDKNSEIIASTNHILLKRTPTWTVKARPEEVYFSLCFVPT